MGLTKEQLEQLNNNSFPNNNSGYITPDILRTYNDAVIVNTVNQTAYTADSASFNYRLQNFNPDNLVTTATFNAYTQSASASVGLLSASYVAFTASYYIDSASFNSRINNFNPTNLVNTASFNAYTASTNAQLVALEAKTGSYLTTGSNSSNQYVSGNLVFTEVNTFINQATAANVNTYNGRTLEFLSGNISTTYPSLYDIVGFGSSVWSSLTVSGAGLSTPLITNMFISGANNVYVTVASGLSVSGSSYVVSGPLPQNVDFKVNNLIVSGNIVTNQSVLTNTIGANSGDKVTVSATTASVNRLEANNISSSLVLGGTVNAVSGNFSLITADSASITYLKVIYQTSSVVYSSGSNILGDNANDDVQTLIGRSIATGSFEVTGSSRFNGNVSITGSGDINNSPIIVSSQTSSMAVSSSTYSISSSVASTLSASISTQNLQHFVTFVDNSTGNNAVYTDGGIKYNPNQDLLLVTNITSSGYISASAVVINGQPVAISQSVSNLSASIYQTDATQSYQIVANALTASNALTNYSSSQATLNNTLSSSIATVSSSVGILTASYNATSASLNTVSSSLNVVSASGFIVSGAFAITSASLNVVSSSLNVVSASAYTVSGSYVATSGSLNSVSSSYNTMSASAVSNVTDTYTSQPLAKYIVTLTQAEYTAIVTKDVNTLYVII